MNQLFGFKEPQWLWLLCGVFAFGLWLLRRERERRRRMALFGQSNLSQKWTMSFAFVLLVSSLLTLAIARPFWGMTEVSVQLQGSDWLLVLDISKSMNAADVSPDRLEVGKRKMFDFIGLIEHRAPGDKLGIVLFAGASYLFCPMTADYAVVRQFAANISEDLISSPGSGLAEALATAERTFAKVESAEPRLILLSDGEESGLDTAALAAKLKQSNVRVFAFGIGTEQGAPIEIAPQTFLKDNKGDIVISKLQMQSLKEIADGSGGSYRKSTLDDSDIEAVLADAKAAATTNFLPESETGRRVKVYNELGPYLLLACAGLLLCAAGARRTFPLLAATILLLFARPVYAEQQDSLHDAYQYYEAGDFARALPIFEEAFKQDSQNARLALALGSTYYKLGKFPEAEKIFSDLSTTAPRPKEAFSARYNLGNSAFAQKKYQAAMKAYEGALKIKPKDSETEFNLALAKKLLEQQQQEQQKKDHEQEKKEQEKPQQASENQDKQERTKEKSDGQSEQQAAEDKDQEQDSAGNQEKEDQKQDEDRSGEGEKKSEQEPKEPSADGDASEGNASDGKTEAPAPPAASQTTHSPEALAKSKADAWLNALPDAPLLMRRQQGRRSKNPNMQTW